MPAIQGTVNTINIQCMCAIQHTVLNISRHTDISTEIPVFYPKWYDKCKILPNIVLDRYGPIYRHMADISADIRDEISDISADIVTYLDYYYFFLFERSFYFILCSLWYFNDVFIWYLDNNLFLLIMSYMYWLLIYQPIFSTISRYITRYPVSGI